MSDADKPKPPAAPFERKPIQWGRMPQATFRVPGSPPEPAPETPPAPPVQQRQAFSQFQAQPSLAPQRAPRPAPRPRVNILGGSLIPQATRPMPPLDLAPRPAEPAPEPAPGPTPTPAPLPPVATPADLSVRALPEAEPHAEAVATAAPLVEAGAPQPVAPLAHIEPVEPDEPARDKTLNDIHVVAARGARRPSRMPWVLGGSLAVLAAVAAGAWWMLNNRPAPEPPVQPQPPMTAVVPALPAPAPVEATPLETLDAAPPETVAPVSTAPTQPAPAPAPAARQAPPTQTQTQAQTQTPTSARPQAQPAPQAATPAPTPQPTAESPPPVVVVSPPPTAARPQQADPDAPIVTRPQPLD